MVVTIHNLYCHLPWFSKAIKTPPEWVVFFLAPLVGLEPTTCGLTDHEPRPQKSKQAIIKPPCPFFFGDHKATTGSKVFFVKMAAIVFADSLSLGYPKMANNLSPYSVYKAITLFFIWFEIV